MDLFSDLSEQPIDVVNQDGLVTYYGTVMSVDVADAYLQSLLHTIQWRNDEVLIANKHIVTKRLVAFYASDSLSYTYSNITKTALPWTKDLLKLKAMVEQQTNETFNSCLLNLYQSGEEGMSWHSDNDPDLKANAAIASLSFGAERKFSFKHKQTNETKSLILQHGSLLVMKAETQRFWLHCLPITKKVDDLRINLTFRTIINR